MKISTFTIVKNESEYIGQHIMSLLPNVDEMVFFDGNSTDGTLSIIRHIQKKYDKKKKIKLFMNKDCANLTTDYVRLFNETIAACTGDYIWFVHPDMICLNPNEIKRSIGGKYIRYTVNMTSLAGEKKDKVISSGRGTQWATIYKNSYGIHYYGYYGTEDEDLYFKDFTGEQHLLYSKNPYLPYEIGNTPIQLVHYCDCKPYFRRLERMKAVLRISNPMKPEDAITQFAMKHPRVTLESGIYGGVSFTFKPYDQDHLKEFKKYGFEKRRKQPK